MAKTRLTKSELKGIVEYDYKGRENYLLMPNEVIEMLVKDEELNRTKAPHVAVAYTYLFLITWMYRYAKYGIMALNNTADKALKRIMGIAETSKEYNYIFKKGGVLDRLGLTETLSYTQAPISWRTDKIDHHGFPEFTYFYEFEETTKYIVLNSQTTKRRQIKEPLLATGFRNPLNKEDEVDGYNGTFYDNCKEYTHMVGMDAFIKCVTTDDLGINAFYMLSFLRSRYGKNTDVSISLETISEESGMKPSTRDKTLKMLKAYHMIYCDPSDFCLERGDLETESSTYWVVEDPSKWNDIANYNFPKRKVYHVTSHVDYVES